MKELDLGQSIGILANIGVIAGIVFLAIEVRSASDANQLQTAYSWAEGFNQINLQMASDPDLSRIFVVGMDDPNRLTDPEAAQFANLIRAITNHGNQIWTQYRLGQVDEESWEASAQQIGQILSTPGGQLYVQSNRLTRYMEAIEPYMGQAMESNFSLGRDPSGF